MIQDIFPYKFYPEYRPRAAKPDDFLLCYSKDKVLLKSEKLPQIQDVLSLDQTDLQFLFSVDDIAFYSPQEPLNLGDGFTYASINIFRKFASKHLALAGVTGYHLATWYAGNKFCGACGGKFKHKENERALVCPTCGRIIYPNISIAVIVAITNGDEILLSKYPGRDNFALIAGFVEIGETLEDTCRREVMEEVGLKIKNLRYYGSQPWGFSQSMMVGFFAELDGPKKITLDTNELAYAGWIKKSEMPESDASISLTATMMEHFRKA